jgi:hypothetical protein
MQSASQLAYPGSRTVAQWWRRLQQLQRGALWVGHAYLHRIEALARTTQPRPLEPLPRLLLQTLCREQSTPCCGKGECIRRLEELLHLPGAILRQVLHEMQRQGLVEQGAAGSWTASERGRQVLDCAQVPSERWERRIFPFLERVDRHGRRAAPPHYAPCGEGPANAWQVPDEQHFDPRLLDESLSQATAWKERFRFPAEVDKIEGTTGTLAPWRHVLVDRAERIFLALVAPTEPGADLLGFAVRTESWALEESAPVLRLPLAAVAEIWPALAGVPEPSALQEAWVSWCRERSLPLAEAEACALSYRPGCLEVQAPERLLQRLRAARSDVFKGESWLLLGQEYLRPAVALQVGAQARP